ncbi:MAG: hypothetical protein ACRC7N_15855 [Clostridium sp.]
MKRILCLGIFLMSFVLSGCTNASTEKLNEIQAPKNNSLAIVGEWEIIDLEIIETALGSGYDKNTYLGEKIKFSNEVFQFCDKQYLGINHKLKVVKPDYIISYEKQFNVRALNLNLKEVDVYSGIYKQNILYEFFYAGDESSYLYFSGVLFEVKRISSDNDFIIDDEVKKEINEEQTYMPEGILLGLKKPSSKSSIGDIIPESYRTLWISIENKSIGKIEERENIIFPRKDGIWEIEKKIIDNGGVYYEYFDSKSLEGKGGDDKIISSSINIQKDIHKSINFVGNDYIATEVYIGDYFNNEYMKYEVLPVDNLLTSKPIVIQDIFSKDANNVYKTDYLEHMKNVSEDQKKILSKYINYENFTLSRGAGKWNIVGRVSSIDGSTNYSDYPVNLKPNKKILNYDTLLVPWKVLKGRFPFIVDAFTSPEGSMALIVLEDKIEVYSMNEAGLSTTPLSTINLEDNEEVIMAEWCTGAYVNKWYNIFKE